MKWLKRLRGIGRKWKVILAIAISAAVILAVLSAVSAHIRTVPDSQRLVTRWAGGSGYAQISAFYTREAAPDTMRLLSFEHTLDATFAEEGIESPGGNARLWLSAYSASGKVTVRSDRGSVSAQAIGVGGDFFLFHPYKLLDGAFFSGNDLMQDMIVIDEETAWQLFGSPYVAGMQVTIGGVPHYITGVIERDHNWMDKRAGVDEMTVYLSYDSLSRYGSTEGISCYELLMPNPVSGYAMELVKKNLGVDETSGVLVENSQRYSLPALYRVIGDFGVRSMQTMRIIWPGWENAARGWEDVLAFILVFQTLCVLILGIVAIVVCRIFGKYASSEMRKWKARRNWKYGDMVQ